MHEMLEDWRFGPGISWDQSPATTTSMRADVRVATSVYRRCHAMGASGCLRSPSRTIPMTYGILRTPVPRSPGCQSPHALPSPACVTCTYGHMRNRRPPLSRGAFAGAKCPLALPSAAWWGSCPPTLAHARRVQAAHSNPGPGLETAWDLMSQTACILMSRTRPPWEWTGVSVRQPLTPTRCTGGPHLLARFLFVVQGWDIKHSRSTCSHIGDEWAIVCQCPKGPSACFHVEWVRGLPEHVPGTHEADSPEVALVLRDTTCVPPDNLFSVSGGLAGGGMKGRAVVLYRGDDQGQGHWLCHHHTSNGHCTHISPVQRHLRLLAGHEREGMAMMIADEAVADHNPGRGEWFLTATLPGCDY
ncbi:hypothetical protein JB92DRAFT_2832206 [Gautieria morchelliformis]|nr:hypothetical protein JB92DRAFT_2832206 [Gautieria morchelliformis]